MTRNHHRAFRVGRATSHPNSSEEGSSAVEFALVVPVLMLIIIGIIELGFAFNSQLQITAAARDAARVVSISAEPEAALAQARTSAVNAAPTVAIDPATVHIAVSPAGTAEQPCPPGSTATVTIDHTVDLLTGLLGETMTVSGKGVMQCGI
ncbi:TadE/TadG family type IV pilus assembly protein [Citricoccus sp. GCM10030269]|uniref:TadE/TadG family type IV pilus assembly protein n=1 Tax=Citricoccus sp. GCM10030269 TaxID=3273388 RepID=UPI003608626F